jgi:hypothetical protein
MPNDFGIQEAVGLLLGDEALHQSFCNRMRGRSFEQVAINAIVTHILAWLAYFHAEIGRVGKSGAVRLSADGAAMVTMQNRTRLRLNFLCLSPQ